MSLRITDGIGRSVYCFNCGKPLIVASADDYLKCESCDQVYNDYSQAIPYEAKQRGDLIYKVITCSIIIIAILYLIASIVTCF